MAQDSRSVVRWLIVAVVGIFAAYLILTFPQPSPQPSPTFTFVSYTNTGGQIYALFRLDHPPQPAFADWVEELRYHTSTGWVRPSEPTFSFDFFGWDGTGSVAMISAETTNSPMRVVMGLSTRRKGILGLYDRLVDRWAKLAGKAPKSRGNILYLTNQTAALPSNLEVSSNPVPSFIVNGPSSH